ncbi:phosphatase PAP2 family protein [Fictibacillus phosphorivorans]|uniref:phosphatase PAP2 family protein n=1 Tax=Fictibacillus phosphorivorans TaxID=1221500 RepID=UPI00203BF73F|nr:phosphatase PAP2 family protein [Fictibacillus phosphorivorans]MCM3720316.1 phosphatase PAP2 family protein [Fictibacillus phosphorivorans]MCM3778013.1 phosphatase PAP2 family protein [Fictibacillus phosphorivorans]
MTLTNSMKRTIILIAVFMVFFMMFGYLYHQPSIYAVDVWSMKHVSHLHQSPLNSLFIFLTNAASRPYQYVIIVLLSIYWLLAERKWREPLVLWICLLGVRFGNHWLKGSFERPRPEIDRIIDITGYSFPSGHAMIPLAFFGMLSYLLVQNYSILQPYKKIIYFLIGLFILLVGFSRVYLGVHYPTDVIGGYLAGGTWLLVCILFYRWLKGRRSI